MQYETLLTQERIDRSLAEGQWSDRTLTDHLRAAAALGEDRVAAVDARGRTTYGQMLRDSERLAFGLLSLGVQPGEVVSVLLPNWSEWIVAHLAAVRIGAVTNPLIPVYRDREVGYMMQTARTRVLITTTSWRGFDYLAMVDRLRPEVPALETVLVVDGPAGPAPEREGFQRWTDFLETPWEQGHESAELDALRPDPSAVSLLMFTSGTTGRPKGVMHNHNTLGAASCPWPDRLGMDHDDVIHMASTFGHLTGYLFGVQLPIQLGAKGVFQDVWNAQRFAELIEQEGITHTSGATPFLHDLIHAPDLDRHDVSSLARFCCMGAPIPRVMVQQARQKVPSMSVFGGWGQTECGLSAMGHPDDPEELVAASDGRALHGVRLRVTDPDGAEAAPGAEGRLWVTGAFLFLGYLGQLERTREEFDGEWFDTGDLATIDENGYLRIVGRSKDVIIRGGENIPVFEVENAIYGHPSVQSVAVVAAPHPRLQEIAAAAIVQRPGTEPLDLPQLQRFLEGQGISKTYWPERVEILEQLPQTPSGKIQKFHLRQRYAEEEQA